MNTLNIHKVLVAVLLGIASICQAVEGTWTRKSDMPMARSGLSTSVVDGKIYAIGGGAPVTRVDQYDPATGTWSKKAEMRIPRVFFSSSVVDGKIYAIGGYGTGGAYLSSVEKYDPVTDIWTSKSRMSMARQFVSSAVVDGKIYAMGGKLSSSTVSASTVEEYDPTTDTWTRKANMTKGRAAMFCSTVDGIVYAIGGTFTAGTGLAGQAVPTVEAYDPAKDTWTPKAPMLTARCFFSTCVVDGRIYAIGGCANPYNSSELSSAEAYDPVTDTWTKMPDMQIRRKALASASVNGKIYAIGGQLNAGWDSPLSTVEEYNLIPPPPDFNGDGLVDINDLLRLIESWDQYDSVVDIAPPFGDGVIDVLDLEFLMSYWKQPIDDPTLVAHWALDEVEGAFAYDNAGVNDAVIVGGTEWLPIGGQVSGALQLNGIDGCAIADAVLNPANGPFSVFAWINGGGPGQVVLSQLNGADWLGLDSDLGCVMTELLPPAVGRFVPQPLISDYVITDGQWHRIGFVWDGANRALYVDDILVAEDTQANLQGSDSGLYIGTGKGMESGTYWAGLIDDVRIYNRALRP